MKTNKVTRVLQMGTVAAVTVLVIVAGVQSASAIAVTGGELTGIGGSSVIVAVPSDVNNANYGAGQTDNAIHLLLDMGSIQNVTSLQITNRVAAATQYSARTFAVSVSAADSGSTNVADYSTVVFANATATSGSTNAANAVQTLDVTDFSKRYVLINFTANFWGYSPGISNVAPGYSNLAQFSNVSVTAVPEPGTIGLLLFSGIGALLLARNRKSSRS